jgi:DNA (cytosine-5)-methyltransferase 1
MTAYYNEIDPYAAEWLRNLIAAGRIAPGDVDERSIKDVRADDLKGYTQCHFFAGIGVWSYALRLAGWPDDRPVWTGSCPCQPFSAAGKGEGVNDERHLWPVWFNLIRQCKPRVVFGEQVEAAIRHGWLDLIQTDLEGIGYAVAPVGIPAAGFGAPHIRQRLWFVADAEAGGQRKHGSASRQAGYAALGDAIIGLDNNNPRLEGQRGGHQAEGRQRQGAVRSVAEAGESGGVVNAGDGSGQRGESRPVERRLSARTESDAAVRAGPTNGHWRNADWLHCRDGKWRPVEPGTFPLAHGAAARVGRLRAYGNAIVPQVAAEVISAYMLG